MGHWAKVEDGIVVQVVVADDDKESWLVENFGGVWLQTSYNTRGGVHLAGGTPLRYNFAGKGYAYDSERDAFIAPKPEGYDSWTLNETTCLWEAPVPMPDDGLLYEWDEATQTWVY